MRLLLVQHAFPPEAQGGSELYAEALSQALAREHEVTVLHAASRAGEPEGVLEGAPRGRVRVLALNAPAGRVGFEAYRDPAASAALSRVLAELRPDLVHVGHLEGLSTGLVFEARRLGAAVVMTLHDFWTLCPLGQLLDRSLRVCPGPAPRRCLGCIGEQLAAPPGAGEGLARAAGPGLPLARRLGRLASRLRPSAPARVERRLAEMREVLRAADVRIAPSRFLRDRMGALGVADVEVLENGHEPLVVPERRPDPRGRVRFGFLGAGIPSKGVHLLAEAVRRLDDTRATLQVHAAFPPYHGETGYEARVRQLLGERAGETLRGPFPPERLGEVLAGLDVVVVPSLWEENAPRVVQEAFLARLPLVVSDHGGLAERVRHGVDGLRFRPGDAADLARVLRRLLDEPVLRAALGSSPPRVPTFEEHAGALAALYAEARGRHASRAGRVGVVVLDRGRPQDAAAAAESAQDPCLAARVLVVENGPGPASEPPAGVERLRLPENRGYAGGMNAGVERLLASGCDRVLLLNNDARLAPGALRRLAEALGDRRLAAAGPVVLRDADGRVESRGARFDLRWGRQRLAGHGEPAGPAEGRVEVEALPGSALMLSAAAWARVGPLDESYFHSFEDLDWCLRARQAGFQLAVVLGARASHAGARTLGRGSPERLYYAARNQLRAAERLAPLGGASRWLRRGSILVLNLAHALRQAEVPRVAGLRAVLEGSADCWRGRFGPRTA